MNTDKNTLYISKDNFFKLLDALKKDYEVYVPVKNKEKRFYKKYAEPADDITIGEVRAFEPLKAFFSRAREVVAEGFKPGVPHSGDKPFAIVGVKACDIKGMKVQDHVFLNHDYKDPFYIKGRQQNLIISSDCTFAIDTCFCLALGLKPYPEEDFDINISVICALETYHWYNIRGLPKEHYKKDIDALGIETQDFNVEDIYNTSMNAKGSILPFKHHARDFIIGTNASVISSPLIPKQRIDREIRFT